MTLRAASLLEARRDELNARFARDAGDLSPDLVLAYLRRTVVPILDAWEGEPAAAVLFALFDLGLVGLRVGLVGESDATAFERTLRERMPLLRAHVEAAPGVVLRALGNGYLHVLRERGPEAAQLWLDALASGAAACADRAALLGLGVVLGWRAGLAEAREVALDHAAHLDPALLRALFGATLLDGDPARRFCRPGSGAALGPLELVATAGGFVGFGGPFRRPPLPRVVAGKLVCTDGTATFELFADVFGTRFRPAVWAHAEAITSADTGGAYLDSNGALHAPDAIVMSAIASGELRGAVAAAACSGMIAVALGDSHQVLVLGRREAAP
ncbi:MAG: hypothetical protein IPQ07_14810 [Myxococcales bacterium]|nr:hypothetical protein [Myxococcales bacterium]